MEQFVNPPLKRAIFGPKTVRGNSAATGGTPTSNVYEFHPPCQPRFQLRLSPEFIYEVAIIIEHRSIGDHMRRLPRSSKFRSNLRVQNP